MIFRVTCVVAAVLPRFYADLALRFSLGSIVPDLILGPRCDSAAVQRAVMRSRADGVALVDLSRAEWFTPFGLVSVLAFIDRQCRDGLLVAFVPPADRNKAGYLNRMRLGDRLDELGVAHTLPFVPSRNNSNLMELHSFDSVSNMERFAQHIHDSVAPTDGKYARALYRSLSEAGENVELHSGLSNGSTFSLRTVRAKLVLVALTTAATVSTVAAVTVSFAQGWFFVALFAAAAVAMVIAHRRATSIPEPMTSLQDLGVLAGQLRCLTMVFGFCWGAVYLTTNSLLPGSLTDRVSAGVSGAALAAIAVGSARGALQCAPALLSQRNVRSAHPLNAVAVVATWTALWVLTCAVLAPVVTVLTTFAVTVGAVLTLAVFFIGVAAVRLRSLHGLVGELAAALDAYYVALTDTATVKTGSEREAYLAVDRLMHLRPVGLMFAAPAEERRARGAPRSSFHRRVRNGRAHECSPGAPALSSYTTLNRAGPAARSC